MQAIERIINNDNWITLVIIFAFVLLAVMKLLKPTKLLGYTIAFFTPGFLNKRVEDNPPFYAPFTLFLFFFSTIIVSLFLFLVVIPNTYEHSWLNYLILFSFTTIYFISRFFLDAFLANVLGLTSVTKYFLFTKSSYLKTLCLWLFPAIIIYQYTFTSKLFLLIIFLILFVFRAFLILKNNKKIVIRKLFYFILYFCTLEIAPLLIVYKITTTT
ncbi:DUF4271 domain-containing protein [Tenacibaculum insulae]|uniref:DUF4271 domain-containing protein n=1 Tax=Tenacibaculum insulae TaxID=2029677 RepID=UPI003AB8B295